MFLECSNGEKRAITSQEWNVLFNCEDRGRGGRIYIYFFLCLKAASDRFIE